MRGLSGPRAVPPSCRFGVTFVPPSSPRTSSFPNPHHTFAPRAAIVRARRRANVGIPREARAARLRAISTSS
ncbi:hypothetical protein WT27_09645 [Burkholderia territorii]|uniref:Uncharacterized protein n=1 Tax=Burkholderia territorii TaxID=1503055 RepID=A0A106DPS5_9BURK|nr:hypothetical protein WT27_09645 [Burkholderia territorii]KVX33171.1 hypothetical protein WT31_09790 [Burkholderia territorii]